MPEEPLQPVGKLTRVSPSEVTEGEKPVGKLKPVGSVSMGLPSEWGTPDENPDDQLENTLNDIVATSVRSISDGEKDILRQAFKNPNLTADQARDMVKTMQGYHEKQGESTIGFDPAYYVKQDKNGVIVPVPLARGERPPKGYQVANVWGQTKGQAQDDSWYTDIAKSLFNALPALAGAAADVGNLASLAVTGEESELMNRTKNTAESLKLFKDDNGGKTLYNPEGIEKMSDLISKERFDFSPEALWNSVNYAAESLPQFLIGAGIAGRGIQGAKALVGAGSELGKAGQIASVFAASGAVQLGENMEAAKEAGLKGRDIAAYASAVTSVQASLDAFTGLDIGATLFKGAYKNASKSMVKEFAKALEKDAEGKITEEAFKRIGKEFAIEYAGLAKNYAGQAVKDLGGEMLQESLQSLTEKAGQQIWDNMSGEDKAKFGTDAFSARSFGEYLASGINSLGMAPMSIVSAKQKYKEQSLDAYNIVAAGKDKVDEFKANVYAAERRGDLTTEERDQAIFKVDAYEKYWEQTKDLPNMDKKERKEAFELSFNIEALKSEIPNKDDVAQMDPIAQSKVKVKEELIKGLQKDLNRILLRQDVQTETKVGQKNVDDVYKDIQPKEGQEKPKTLSQLTKELGALRRSKTEGKVDLNPTNGRVPIKDISTPDWNDPNKTTSLRKKQVMQEELKKMPNNEMAIDLQEGQNGVIIGVLEGNKRINLAQSAKATVEGAVDYIKRENLPEVLEETVDDAGRPLKKYKGKVMAKRVEIDARDLETDEVIKDENGNPKRKAVISIYNPETGGHIGFQRELDPYKGKYVPSKYSPTEKAELKAISEANHLTEQINPYKYNPPSQVAPTKPSKPVKKTTPVTPKKEVVRAKNEAKLAKEAVDKIYASAPKTFEEAVLRFLYKGGRISTKDFKRYTGFGEVNKLTGKTKGFKEFKKYIWAHKNGAVSIDSLVKRLWEEDMGLSEENFDEQDRINEFFSVLNEHSGKGSILGRLFETQKETKEADDYADPALIQYAKDLEAEEKANYERDLSDTEIQEELEKEEAREKVFAETGQFQKTAASKGDVQKVLDRIKKVMPKVNVVIDNKLDAAGKVQGNTLTINPYYAGTDTPIHEAGHVLIDALGYKNALIQAAIKQLKDTKLWKETKERYPELNDEMLAKEVLAEAIGREGANIFDKEIDKSKFRAILDRIFEKLKQLLGIDKNIAKSLARQIIRGEGTKELVGISAEEQFSKRYKSADERAMEDLYETLLGTEDLSIFPYEKLLEAYNLVITSNEIPGDKSNKIRQELLKRMGMNIFQRGINMVRNDPKFSEEKAVKKDISWLDKHFKVLSHFTEAFPEMKFLADKFQEAFFNKTTEANQKKTLNEKLAIKVIEDRRKKLGLAGKAKDRFGELFGNQNYKYFDYLDNGKGDLITVTEAQKKGLSEAQINYLKFVREQIAEREGIIGSDSYDMDMAVIKTDKRFYESYNTENAVSAMSALLGNTHNINKVRIEFKNPNTGKSQTTEYENIEKMLIDYGKKGLKQKAEAVAKITYYNIKARKQLKQMVNADEKGQENVLNVIRKGDYSLTDKGQLVSKFDKPRDPSRAYSKDFYSAMVDFIDDTQHVKHISPLLPIINSIDYLNKNGVYQYDEFGNKKILHAQKDNVKEWLKGWVDLHVIKRPNETDPTIDAALKTLRTIASLSTMMFNTAAQGMNLAIGIYNNWRKENSQTVALGLARLFGGADRRVNKDAGYGLVNPVAAAILKKYGAVSTDITSNPIATAGGVFAKLGFLGTKWGEYVIQGSGLLGKMTKEEFDSFELVENKKFKVEELAVKKGSPFTEEELKKKILGYIDEVSDVQGKYSEKDRRNIMNNEFGKALMQYKVWMPDWFRVRFGEKGSWTTMMNGGIKEMRDQLKDEGFMKTFIKGEDTQAVKDFKSNLKGLMTTVFLLTLVHSDDDDKEKSKVLAVAKRALGDVLFVFDPNNLKFTLNRPIASIGKINDLLDAANSLKDLEFAKAGSKASKLLPGKKIVDVVEDFTDED